MAYFMMNYKVKRIPENAYNYETFTCDSIQQTPDDVDRKLNEDKNVIDFSSYLPGMDTIDQDIKKLIKEIEQSVLRDFGSAANLTKRIKIWR